MNPFERALDLFGDDGRGWTKHSSFAQRSDGQMAYCAGGALAVACGMLDIYGQQIAYGDHDPAVYLRERAAFVLSRRINAERAAAGLPMPIGLATWNDVPSTTFEDVVLMFKQCAAEWEDDA